MPETQTPPEPSDALQDPEGYSIDYTDDGRFRVIDRRDWHEVGVFATRLEAVQAALDEAIPRWSADTMRLPAEAVDELTDTD